MAGPKHFSMDARAILTLGRESIKDHVTAALELVKNSYDADATIVEVHLGTDADGRYFRISDNGTGMTEREVEDNWLRIGFSAKRDSRRRTKRDRRSTGEKGIGRLSADRLGATLDIRTKARGNGPVGLSIDWSKFEEPGTDFNEIPIALLDEPTPTLPEKGKTGTELVIRSLRQRWSQEDLMNLRHELMVLCPPHLLLPDFTIKLHTGVPSVDGEIGREQPFEPELTIDLELRDQNVRYTVRERGTGKRSRIRDRSQISWKQLVHSKKSKSDSTCCLGKAEVRLAFYPRKTETLRGTDFRIHDLKGFLDRHSGIKIYRDSIRVRPYGSNDIPEGDWLALGKRKSQNPAGRARKSYRVSPAQLVGAVLLGRDSTPEILDSSSREGLVHNEAYKDLKRLVLGAVALLETHYYQQGREAKDTGAALISPPEMSRRLANAVNRIRGTKRAVESGSPEKIDAQISMLLEALPELEEAQKTAEEMASQNTVLRGLATLGIASAVFGHETQSALAQAVGSAKAARLVANRQPDRLAEEFNALDESLEKVSAWGKFALSRVRRDKRRKKTLDVGRSVRDVLRGLKVVFRSAGIELDDTRVEEVKGRTFGMDIDAVLVNLLTNAYSAVQQNGRASRISVEVRGADEGGRAGFEIVVSDSGPGVAKKFQEVIWEPLFSTKADGGGEGTGLGLSIIRNIVDENQGAREVTKDKAGLRGARFRVWIPFA